MDTTVQIDIEQAQEQLRTFQGGYEWYSSMCSETIDLFRVLSDNISGGSTHQTIEKIIEYLTIYSNKSNELANEAYDFTKKQIDAYVSTYDGALKNFQYALQRLEEIASYLIR